TPRSSHAVRALDQRNDLLSQRLDAPPPAGHQGHDRNAQFERQLFRVNPAAVFLRDVDHVQGNNAGITQLDNLRRVVEISFQIRRVHDDDDEVELLNVVEPVEQNVTGN